MKTELYDLLPGFEDILIEKSFDQLTDDQKRIILENMSSDEYNRMHNLANLSRQAFANEESELTAVPRLTLPEKTTGSRGAVKPAFLPGIISYISRLLVYPVPVYQFSLVLIVLAALFIPVKRNSAGAQNFIPMRDTVYVIKTVYDTLFKEAPGIIAVSKVKTNDAKTMPMEQIDKSEIANCNDSIPMNNQYRQAYASALRHTLNEKKGLPVNNDSSIAGKFVTAVSTM